MVTVEYTGPGYMARRFLVHENGQNVSGRGYLFGANAKRARMPETHAEAFVEKYTSGELFVRAEFDTAYMTDADSWKLVENDDPVTDTLPSDDSIMPKPAAEKSRKASSKPASPSKSEPQKSDGGSK